MATTSSASRVAYRLNRFGRAPRITKSLRKDRATHLPIPHVPVLTTREFAPNRLKDHYHTTLADDLMYLTYTHEPSGVERKAPRQIRLKFDPEDPYSKFRHNPPVGGSQVGKKPAPPSTPEDTVRLEKIQIHTFIKESLQNKSALLSPIMMLRALTGETAKGGGQHAVEGIQLVKGRKAVGGWIRPGVPVGAKVDLRGQSMYDFLNTLTEFVLPRLRDFNGIVLPPKSSSSTTPSTVSGVVSFGLPPEAMVFFPQLEVNVDAYPMLSGIHIHFVTNAKGKGAQDKARALVSGFQVPFVRR
ncbi:hypothetical protein EST38_g4363 [Candolleomyces aberdarensis]|uniref:Large ribosomal subunit protein uL5 C-terminal domain-containing protein n=1 Tax=Candolleomyces aberdarensis TaxID=2316362 RepID=A0A4Q2DRG5_9AGAR|nr:hypothetical protein EST38_g4363 [Candolleomyces aberdarensis]